MDKFIFIEDWLDLEKNFISVKCTTDNAFYCILIHTYDDPYTCYYQEGVCPEKELKTELEKELFAYFHSKYPDHWD